MENGSRAGSRYRCRAPSANWSADCRAHQGRPKRGTHPRVCYTLPGARRPEIDDVLRLVPLSGEPAGKCGQKLRVDEEPHQATRRTTWSACWAAHSSAAVMSPASSDGKSARIPSRLAPAASRSSTSLTRMRRPRRQGLPPHWFGSMVMRCLSLMKGRSLLSDRLKDAVRVWGLPDKNDDRFCQGSRQQA